MEDKKFLFPACVEIPSPLNPPSYPCRKYMAGRMAVSINAKSNLVSALQAFGYGGDWPQKAPRMPQDGRSPEDFIWGERHKPMSPYGYFSYPGKPNVPKSLYVRPREKFEYPGSFPQNLQDLCE